MKTYGISLVLVMASVLLFTALPCGAAEKNDENFWLDDKPKQDHRRFELTNERIERIMGRLAENDPEKAKELEQLRQEDPEKFKAELRETMREHFGKMSRGRNMQERFGRMSRGRNMQERFGRMSRGRNMRERFGRMSRGRNMQERFGRMSRGRNMRERFGRMPRERNMQERFGRGYW